ncbi:unnamed protein product, partial [Amoebophrya sp. A25]
AVSAGAASSGQLPDCRECELEGPPCSEVSSRARDDNKKVEGRMERLLHLICTSRDSFGDPAAAATSRVPTTGLDLLIEGSGSADLTALHQQE